MNEARDHHYVPQFLLKGWCGPDGRLAIYSRKKGRIVIDRRSPRHTAFEPHLYTISALPEDRQWVERELMTKNVDTPAALILRRLLAGDLKHFNSDDRTVWARFMMAQWWRSPEVISKLRREGRETMIRALEARPEDYEALRGTSPHTNLLDWVDTHFPGYDEVASMGTVLPGLINDKRAGQIIVNMDWQVLQLTGSKLDLLVSDRPVFRYEGILSPNCVIVVPLSPRTIFVASHGGRDFTHYSPTEIARKCNVTMVASSAGRVYGTGEHHLPLVEKRLRTTVTR